MNILKAIINLKKNLITDVKNYQAGSNRAQNSGKGLEDYIKDLFANSYGIEDNDKRLSKLQEVFSFLGSANNPPDAILKEGDAIEIKKIASFGSGLALNSSYPKAKLLRNSPYITNACKECEATDWTSKDIIYAVGIVKDNKLRQLQMVYGTEYAADAQIYTSLKNKIVNGIDTVSDVKFSETKEFGRVNNVDPTDRTYLRLRGMWGIKNPGKAFKDFYDINEEDKDTHFKFMCLINNEKYNGFSKDIRDELESIDGINIIDIEVPNPNNFAKMIPAKLITFSEEI